MGITWYNVTMEISQPDRGNIASREGFKDQYPYPEDWIALQGGMPRVFRNPKKPDSVWLVTHVYEEHTDPELRFQSGMIVETLPPHGQVPLSRYEFIRKDFEGNDVKRDIIIPSFMHRRVHGEPCEDRSAGYGTGQYSVIKSQVSYEMFLVDIEKRGFQEVRFSIDKDGFTLNPLLTIRKSRSLM